jgi:hypothetical protein
VNILKILHAENEENQVLENKKCLGALFWQNWVNKKIVKFRARSRPDHMHYFNENVQQKIAKTG